MGLEHNFASTAAGLPSVVEALDMKEQQDNLQEHLLDNLGILGLKVGTLADLFLQKDMGLLTDRH